VGGCTVSACDYHGPVDAEWSAREGVPGCVPCAKGLPAHCAWVPPAHCVACGQEHRQEGITCPNAKDTCVDCCPCHREDDNTPDAPAPGADNREGTPMYDLHFGLTTFDLAEAHASGTLADFAEEVGGTVYDDGDYWQEWGGVPGNVSVGLDFDLRHVVVRVASVEHMSRLDVLAEAAKTFAMTRMVPHDTVAVITASDDWSVVYFTLAMPEHPRG